MPHVVPILAFLLQVQATNAELGNIAGWWIGIAIAVVAVLIWRKRRRAPAVAPQPRRGR